MDAEPPYDYLLDGSSGPTPGREELLAIVARSRARRYRVVALGMAATLAVGALGGWLVGSGSSKPSGGATLAAGDPSTTEVGPGFAAAATAVAPGAVASSGTVQPLVKRFVRTTSDGVTIRAYEQTLPEGVVMVPPCGIGAPAPVVQTSFLEAEVSTAAVATQTGSGYGQSEGPFRSFSESTVGIAEGAPVWVVTVQTDEASVAQVKATFADGTTDQMAPVAGWAVLAHVVPPKWVAGKTTANGTIDAVDAAGKSIAGVGFQAPGVISGPPTTLIYPVPDVVPATGSGASASAAAPIGPITATIQPTTGVPDTAPTCASGVPPSAPTTVPAVPAVPAG